jgi:hypothetical protein
MTPRRIWSSSMDSNRARKLPSPKPFVALALDELEEDRPDHGLGEDLQQDLGHAAVDDAFAVDQDAVFLHPVDRLVMAVHPVGSFS